MATETAPTLADVEAARARLAGKGVRVTPLYASETFGRMTGRPVHLKAETLQRTGSFKIRGAVNKIGSLSEAERKAGVVAASAGNHGQAVAWAAREAGIEATIFMPAETPMAKVEPTRNYGARAELTGATFEDAVTAAVAHVEETGATFVHPFEDPDVIAGQGTIGLELVEQLPEVETVVIPIGGGGLASGIGLTLRALRPEVRIVGVQAAACAPLAGRHAVRLHDRRGNRGQAPGRADLEPARRPARVGRHRHRRGDQPGDRAPDRAGEARRRGRRSRGASRRCSPAASRATDRRSRSSPAATSTRRC